MLIGVNIPDEYVGRWLELQKNLGFENFDTFVINALGIGVRTMDSVSKISSGAVGEVISFNPDYY
jgi:hypothetical protein